MPLRPDEEAILGNIKDLLVENGEPNVVISELTVTEPSDETGNDLPFPRQTKILRASDGIAALLSAAPPQGAKTDLTPEGSAIGGTLAL